MSTVTYAFNWMQFENEYCLLFSICHTRVRLYAQFYSVTNVIFSKQNTVHILWIFRTKCHQSRQTNSMCLYIYQWNSMIFSQFFVNNFYHSPNLYFVTKIEYDGIAFSWIWFQFMIFGCHFWDLCHVEGSAFWSQN